MTALVYHGPRQVSVDDVPGATSSPISRGIVLAGILDTDAPSERRDGWTQLVCTPAA